MTQTTTQPARHLRRKSVDTPMDAMLTHLYITRRWNNNYLDKTGYAGLRVLGFKLPAWQCSDVWSDEQCIRFIESIWLGADLGTFMVNLLSTGADVYMVNTLSKGADGHLVLLDGQQRLRAIERYWDGELAMTGEDGNTYRWDELDDYEQRQFLRSSFPVIETQYRSDEELRAAYVAQEQGIARKNLLDM